MSIQGTIELPCDCKSEFQDKLYGKGKRLHNILASRKQAACTICSGGAKRAKRNSLASPPVANRPTKNI